ncbi:MAG: DUF1993 domain-containing protein [Rhizomicrobium sp.]
MKISMHVMAVETFVPMLDSLSAILDKGEAHAKAAKIDLVGARLAPDMYTLGQQVQLACDHAKDGTARLAGREPPKFENREKTIAELKSRIARTIEYVKGIPAASFEGAENRDCSIPIPDNDKMIIAMNGQQFLKAWALPHFYFHLVTAYDILRHNGVVVGKRDYLSQVGAFVRPRTKA